MLLEAITIVCVSGGVAFFALGVLALLRFRTTATRLHALTKADNVGLGLIVVGLLPQVSWPGGAVRLVFAWCLVLLASAVAGTMFGTALRDERAPS